MEYALGATVFTFHPGQPCTSSDIAHVGNAVAGSALVLSTLLGSRRGGTIRPAAHHEVNPGSAASPTSRRRRKIERACALLEAKVPVRAAADGGITVGPSETVWRAEPILWRTAIFGREIPGGPGVEALSPGLNRE
jgi:hypothetical protein